MAEPLNLSFIEDLQPKMLSLVPADLSMDVKAGILMQIALRVLAQAVHYDPDVMVELVNRYVNDVLQCLPETRAQLDALRKIMGGETLPTC